MKSDSRRGRLHRTAFVSMTLAAALALAAWTSSTRAVAKTTCSVKVLLQDNFTGAGSSNGVANLAGAELAIKRVNAQGGVLGCPLKLTKVDDASNYANDLPLMEQALGAQHYALVMTDDYGCASVAPLIKREGLLFIGACATTAVDTKTAPTEFDSATILGRYAEVAGAFGLQQGCKRWAILVDNTSLGKGDEEAISEVIKARGGTVTDLEDGLDEAGVDFSAAVLRAKASNPQCVFTDMFGAAAAHLKLDIATAGWKIPQYGGAAEIASSFKGLVPLADVGNYEVGPASMAYPSTPATQKFVNSLKASGVTINNFLYGYGNGHDPITLFAWAANQTHSLNPMTIATKLHKSGNVRVPGLVEGKTTGFTPTCGEWDPKQGFAIVKAGYYNDGRLPFIKYASAPLPLPSDLGAC